VYNGFLHDVKIPITTTIKHIFHKNYTYPKDESQVIEKKKQEEISLQKKFIYYFMPPSWDASNHLLGKLLLMLSIVFLT